MPHFQSQQISLLVKNNTCPQFLRQVYFGESLEVYVDQMNFAENVQAFKWLLEYLYCGQFSALITIR